MVAIAFHCCIFCRSGQVLPVFLGYLIKLSCLVQSSGPKMLLITCSTFSMNSSQETIHFLLHTTEIDRNKCFMLGQYHNGVIQHQQSLMVRSLPYISSGGMWCGSCNGIMPKGCFFLLLLLNGFYVNCRYYILSAFIF